MSRPLIGPPIRHQYFFRGVVPSADFFQNKISRAGREKWLGKMHLFGREGR